MQTQPIVPIFLRHEYDAILALGNLELPATYDWWLEQRAKEKAKYAARGIVENETVVHPQEFALYCQRCGQDVSLTMLHAFAVAKAYGYK